MIGKMDDRIVNFTTNNQGHGVDADLVDRNEKIIKTEGENSDATECSSSFDSCLSDQGDVESDLDSHGFGELFNMRRRKLSSHWRSFVHPIMWRCKWIELQINKLEAQHKKCERKLEECKMRISTLEGDGTKSLTFPHNHEFRRRKRRRAEATTDIEAYMSNHNVFSYYETILHPEKKKPTPHHVVKDPVKIDNEFWGDDELLDSEDEHEAEMSEDILGVIKGLHSQVVEMRSRIEKVTGEDGNLGPQNSTYNTTCGMSMASLIASQLLSGGAVNTDNHNHQDFTCEYNDDDVLIDNHRVTDELCYLGIEEQVKKIYTIQRQTPTSPLLLKHDLDTTRPPHFATNDPATTSTKTSNMRPKTKGRGG